MSNNLSRFYNILINMATNRNNIGSTYRVWVYTEHTPTQQTRTLGQCWPNIKPELGQ